MRHRLNLVKFCILVILRIMMLKCPKSMDLMPITINVLVNVFLQIRIIIVLSVSMRRIGIDMKPV